MEIKLEPYHMEDAEVFIGPDAEEWSDVHAGETGIVMGSGESLNDMPRELLEKYPTFGVNHIYLLPFQPTYFCSIDDVFLRKYAREMCASAANAKLAFLSIIMLGVPEPGLKELYQLENVRFFGENTIRFPGECCMSGENVPYVLFKIAYAMGFTTILLTGCDRDKEWKYFSDDYPTEYLRFRTKGQWEVKRARMDYHFKIASEIYKKDGRRIVNLSLPSDLDEFLERGKIEDWL